MRSSAQRLYLLETFISDKLRSPIRIIQLRHHYAAVRCMDEFPVAEVDSHVADAGFVGVFEEYEVTRYRIGHRFRLAVVAFRVRTGDGVARFVEYIVDESTAVESGWRRTGPFIRSA